MASYMIEMDGSISNIQIRESSGKIYSEEVVRVLSEMPKWKPRFRNGYTVLDKLYQTFIFNCTVAK
jgi:protein TonB